MPLMPDTNTTRVPERYENSKTHFSPSTEGIIELTLDQCFSPYQISKKLKMTLLPSEIMCVNRTTSLVQCLVRLTNTMRKAIVHINY